VREPRPAGHRARLAPIDAARGLALLLMVADHGATFARVSVLAESYAGRFDLPWGPGWVALGLLTNISAPMFWFLAGTSVALMSHRERVHNSTDDFLLIRAGALMLLDLALVSWEWNPLRFPRSEVTFDLLTCLGVAMLLLIPVRRLPDRALAVLSGILLFGYAALVRWIPQAAFEQLQFPLRVMVTYDSVHHPAVSFPVLGWFGLMTLGVLFGRRLADGRWRDGRPLRRAAVAGLALWLVVRLTGFGSAGAWHPAQGFEALWIMGKGPPALDYLAFNMSLGWLTLSALIDAGESLTRAAPSRWLIAWGQAPLFMFLAHLLVAFGCARLAMHVFRHADIPRYLFTVVAACAILLPMARGYRELKLRHSHTLLHFL
jgi:uncharacterized membrane protein